MTETITSPQNPRYKQLKKLAESAATRRALGQTLLDGEHLLAAALDAGIQPHLVLTSLDAPRHSLLARCPSVEHLQLAPGLFNVLSPVKTPTGVLALIDIPAAVPPASSSFCVLLEAIQDPGNLGTMLRSAAAAGVDAVYLSPQCADAWSPRVLRAGMGAHFVMPIVEHADLCAVARDYAGAVCAAELGAAQTLYQTDLRGAVVFAVGNEGAGLSAELCAAARVRFSIPMPGRVESLNAAAALAVCLFERVRQQE
jgi:TrmH family RNA methyltransferase